MATSRNLIDGGSKSVDASGIGAECDIGKLLELDINVSTLSREANTTFSLLNPIEIHQPIPVHVHPCLQPLGSFNLHG